MVVLQTGLQSKIIILYISLIEERSNKPLEALVGDLPFAYIKSYKISKMEEREIRQRQGSTVTIQRV